MKTRYYKGRMEHPHRTRNLEEDTGEWEGTGQREQLTETGGGH